MHSGLDCECDFLWGINAAILKRLGSEIHASDRALRKVRFFDLDKGRTNIFLSLKKLPHVLKVCISISTCISRITQKRLRLGFIADQPQSVLLFTKMETRLYFLKIQ